MAKKSESAATEESQAQESQAQESQAQESQAQGPQIIDDLTAAVAFVCNVDRAEVAGVNEASAVAVIITKTDAYKVSFKGGVVTRLPDAYTEAQAKAKATNATEEVA